ncbi:pyridoxamine 5'-phosphate oxidase family protein [Paenibacillus kribbensis]|uniref:pyridoxamine 5'-phosphate oxidase family protein n=1 Tax=Paenibacillus kribbensis TaxID=172713 RepID=UPI000838D2F2|nr:pyridoxamine 5'-phosphate oxidase family protein [Paenibacillus kribbensis]
MEFQQEFNNILGRSGHIALATSAGNIPNVRIVSSYYDQAKNTVYFPTFPNSPKTLEFVQNDKVAFTTIPEEGIQVVRVQQAVVRKSELSVAELKDGFARNIPNFEESLGPVIPILELYELHFSEALVTLSHHQTEKIELTHI